MITTGDAAASGPLSEDVPSGSSNLSIGDFLRFPTMHTLVAIVLSYSLLFADARAAHFELKSTLVLLLLAATAVIWKLPSRFTEAGWFVGSWLLADTVICIAFLYLSGEAGSDLYISLFLLLMLAAFSTSILQAVLLSLTVCGGYAVVMYALAPNMAHFGGTALFRISILLIMAAFYANNLQCLRLEQQEKDRLAKQVRVVQETLQATQEKLQLFLDSASDAIFFLNNAGKIEWANAQAAILAGRIDLAGKAFTNLLSTPSAQMARQRLVSLANGDYVEPDVDMELLRGDGRPVAARFSTTSIRKNGALIGRLLIGRQVN